MTAMHWLPLAMTWLVVALAPSLGAAKPSPARECRRECGKTSAVCAKQAVARRAALRAACSGSRPEVRRCRTGAKRAFAASRSGCRRFRKTCRACCRQHGTACAQPHDTPTFSGAYPVPDRRILEQLPLPPVPGGRGLTLLALPDGTLAVDPTDRSPVSAAAECATLVLACYEPALRNWAGCLERVPVCATDTPWEGDDPFCCPASCAVRYQELRREGRSAPAAMAAAIWEEPSCMPGLAGHPRPAAP